LQIKGKGFMRTYFVNGEHAAQPFRACLSEAVSESHLDLPEAVSESHLDLPEAVLDSHLDLPEAVSESHLDHPEADSESPPEAVSKSRLDLPETSESSSVWEAMHTATRYKILGLGAAFQVAASMKYSTETVNL
jgi:hypothetical protein